MSPADSARFELAKRAYQATQPSELEVQTGVRRARLALRRPKRGRKWLMKGLVFVVLALGGLAYAKPHALGELVERARPLLVDGGRAHAGAAMGEVVAPAPPLLAPAPAPPLLAPAPTAEAVTEPAPVLAAKTPPFRRAKPALKPASPALTAPTVAASADPPTAAPRGAVAVSEWGRVGQALARGDEAGALAALSKLADSEDARTRDKADLGRAQLLMARGNRDEACALARSLTRRRAGGHIERQAQVILESCSR